LAACISKRPCYVLEGSVFVGGAVVKWLRDEMRMIKKAEETERYATQVEDTNGVYILPAFVGLGAPHWDSDVRGTVIGLTRGTKKEHFIRAALESIAYQVHDILRAMEEDLGSEIHSLFVDGGASANNFLMQFQADILGVNVVRPKVIEVTALGAAYLAGLQVGYWNDIDDIRQNVGVERVFEPKMASEIRDKLLAGWRKCIVAAKGAK
ncbi:MAG TPA: FGGY-family carbohydrate kinase, partial [Bacilli bacterium]